ncbi:phage tail assembly chaperone family protein, TAC [Pseudomonas aeruginosa]|uniref:phage tail assembly chaperone family protein, TAC n=2 Tax=Pseudomonas aeruginosa TaxID=287 RepID=UPI000FC40878|nr:phage tail assembly chaperone family protein, TAC [Pseudomonas aeruginosa]MEE3522912.1 phage tail assembly chaperone family protein, TAC [Pseudomonas aeruginosa]NBK29454.1 phage tail protein [Pseudomonas aeruginosa]NBY84179.1 phage tail protein [Pseudomonas aeruginosa]NPX03278.1 phage tail protein [Pseudomonas aeruginosa]RUK29030.1 phage tail protein [Pseudomonas aeruginosa]
MQLSISNLATIGAFTGAPVEREITWKQGDKEVTATVYVKPLSYSTAVSDLLAMNGKVDGIAGRIAASIVDEKGKPVFTPADITGEADPSRGALDGNLTIALLTVIAEVNNLGKTTSSAN